MAYWVIAVAYTLFAVGALLVPGSFMGLWDGFLEMYRHLLLDANRRASQVSPALTWATIAILAAGFAATLLVVFPSKQGGSDRSLRDLLAGFIGSLGVAVFAAGLPSTFFGALLLPSGVAAILGCAVYLLAALLRHVRRLESRSFRWQRVALLFGIWNVATMAFFVLAGIAMAVTYGS